jgi:predicted MFS family arabinose efflux permease
MARHDFTRREQRVVAALAGVYGMRMAGLYMVLPVLSLYAGDLRFSTPLLIGLAVGIYGFTQMLLQIPFGMWSDRLGRKPVLAIGLLVFALGSLVAGLARDAWVLVLGRSLQGAGAIASPIIATLADLTRPSIRTQAMAVIGLAIGLSFAGGFIFGPPLAHHFGVPFLFYLTAAGAVLAIPVLAFSLPRPPQPVHHQELEPSWNQLGGVLRDRDLLRLDAGIFLLHFALTGLLVILPYVLDQYIPQGHVWRIYTPVLLGGLLLMVVVATSAERLRWIHKAVYLGAGSLSLAFLAIPVWGHHLAGAVVGLSLFVIAVAVLEPILPALLSRHAPATTRGTAAGAFSMFEFFGAFLGGLMGGFSLRSGHSIFYFLVAGGAIVWGLLMHWQTRRPERDRRRRLRREKKRKRAESSSDPGGARRTAD